MSTPVENAKQTVVPGSCLCGAVRFEVELPKDDPVGIGAAPLSSSSCRVGEPG
jgi:hypothetical protein